MSKEKVKVDIHGYATGHFKRIEGRLMMVIETAGLPDKQEDAIKGFIRNEIWDLWDKPSFSETKEVENPTAILYNSRLLK